MRFFSKKSDKIFRSVFGKNMFKISSQSQISWFVLRGQIKEAYILRFIIVFTLFLLFYKCEIWKKKYPEVLRKEVYYMIIRYSIHWHVSSWRHKPWNITCDKTVIYILQKQCSFTFQVICLFANYSFFENKCWCQLNL